ncbi:hypothetical protein GWI33_009364 [Rhynchophorus ferrugineus]|uniref:Uncharacterized protein n=1 Tax=Rhynchophorus ferrugineus TaxID=354439 RepID=A0A834MKP3_RHYFE|nr:hypothetical protein GWI33_009364 [Rhynchophorus ferrugineus]
MCLGIVGSSADVEQINAWTDTKETRTDRSSSNRVGYGANVHMFPYLLSGALSRVAPAVTHERDGVSIRSAGLTYIINGDWDYG